MPISRRNFELGILPEVEEWMTRVYHFLSAHRGDAFAYGELWNRVEGPGNPPDAIAPHPFQIALSELLERAVITAGEVSSERYYTFRRDMDTNSWRPL